MSQTQSLERQHQQSPYRRDNYWGEDVDGTDETTGHDPKPFHYRKERCEYVSNDFWKQTAERLLCPVAFHDPGEYDLHAEPCEVEVTDPELYVPKRAPEWHAASEYGASSHRVRYNPEYGNITGPLIPNRKYEKFMAGVEDLLKFYRDEHSLADRNIDTLRETAARRKRAGDDTDFDIVADLMADAWRMAKTGE